MRFESETLVSAVALVFCFLKDNLRAAMDYVITLRNKKPPVKKLKAVTDHLM